MAISDRAKGANSKAVLMLKDLDDEFLSETGYRKAAMMDQNKRDSMICKKCNLENELPLIDIRSMQCRNCKWTIWITADTFYHRVRLFRPRVVIMRWLEMGVIVSANQAAKLLKVSNDTVNLIYRQVGIVASKLMLDNTVEEPSYNCLDIMDRRSTETPAREPAAAEEFEIQAITRKYREDATEPDLRITLLTEDEKSIFEILSEKERSFDQIADQLQIESSALSSILMTLQLDGLVQPTPGDKFARSASPTTTALQCKSDMNKIKTCATGFMYFVKDYFQGISRKYLQLYVSLHWLSFDRKRWTVDSLRKACASHPHISYEETLAFVTPPIVKFVSA